MATETETVITVTPAPVSFKRFAVIYFGTTFVVALLAGLFFNWNGGDSASLLMRITAIFAMFQGLRQMRRRGAKFGPKVLVGIAGLLLCHAVMYGVGKAFFPQDTNPGYAPGNVAGPR